MSLRSKLGTLTSLAAFAAGCAVLYGITPEKTWWMPPCLFNKLTGLYCPGCGTARGLHKLLHGDMLGALRMNCLMVLSIPLVIYLAVGVRRRPNAKHGSPPAWVGWTVAVVVAAFWIARNIPHYPFTLLAPH